MSRQSVEQEMFSQIASWDAGTLSQRDFCAEHQLAYHRFYYWLKKYRQRQEEQTGFVALHPYAFPAGRQGSSSAEMTIRYPNGVELELSSHPDLSTLKTLLRLFS